MQDVTLSDGRPLWQHVAELVAEWGADLVGERGLSSVGAVVGATHPRAVAEARRLMPRTVLLLPGVGAQGAGPAELARAFTSGPASALVTASRSVNYAFRESNDDYKTAAGAEAARASRRSLGRLGLVAARPFVWPLALLAAATIAIVGLRVAFHSSPVSPTRPDVAHVAATPRYYHVRPGDTLAGVAAKTGVPVTRLLELNPKLVPTALFLGQRIRLR